MKTRNILSFLVAFLGLGAIYGGGLLIISPSGNLLGVPISILEDTPFTNFLLPGIILFVILGIIPLLVCVALVRKSSSKIAEKCNFFKDMHWSWSFAIYIAFALIIWIQVQETLVGATWIHTFYIFLAILILFISLLPQTRRLYKL